MIRTFPGEWHLASQVGSRVLQDPQLQEQIRKQAPALIQSAVLAYQGGRHADVRTWCQAIVDVIPDHFDALHLLGVVEIESGRCAEAEQALSRAIAINPSSPDVHSNLGIALFKLERFAQARKSQEMAIALRPDFPIAITNLGNTLMRLGLTEQALQAHGRAIRLKPDYADAHVNRGMLLLLLKRIEDAERDFDRALSLQPRHLQAMAGKGLVCVGLNCYDAALAMFDAVLAINPALMEILAHRGRLHVSMGQSAKAEADLGRVLAAQPRNAQAMAGKGVLYMNLRRFDAALAQFDASLAIDPAAADILTHRGRLHQASGRFAKAEADFDAALAIDGDLEEGWLGKAQIAAFHRGHIAEAVAICNEVLARNPHSEIAHLLLGSCRAREGDVGAAIAHMDRALAIRPDFAEAITHKIFTLDFADVDFAVHQAARKSWWDAVGSRVPRRRLKPRNLDPERRIVVGYVSSDFRQHSAAFIILPMLLYYDRESFEVVCYSCSPQRDAVTDECRSLVDRWVDASQFSDEQLADGIEADRIDILVDLSGHSDGNRLMAFAAKPAPIQATGWGHGTGTGLRTMDYMFSDAVLIPQDVRHLFAEQVHDLPCLITMDGPKEQSSSPLPMIRNGHVTFGVFNRNDKISDHVLSVWSRLLQAVPGSVIVIKNGSLNDAPARDRLVGRFVANGVAADRIRCLAATARHEHLREFANVDISLDTFPQNGGASTMESLQMGVPVVAKLGASCSSRAGGAIIKAAGLHDWVAEDDEGYIAIARRYAARPDELAALRARLPAMLTESEVGNSRLYVRRVDEAYRQFWRGYCASPVARESA